MRLKVNLLYKEPGDLSPSIHSNIFLYTYLGENIPSDLKEQYPKITNAPPFSNAFHNKIIGMREGEEREFSLSSSEAGITNSSGEYGNLYRAEILFHPIEFLEMLYDAKYEPIVELSLFHPVILMLSTILIVSVLIIYKKGYIEAGGDYLARKLKPRCAKCGNPTNYRCGNQMCQKNLCRSCFSGKGGCPFCKYSSLKSGSSLFWRKK
ncbi:MAG: hypothetical protein ACFE9L_18490 [Candidatus Hodarchaeota archaeon]